MQFNLRLAAGLLRRGQQRLVELAGVQRVAERRGAIGVADDRLAQVEPGLAQAPRRPLGAVECRRPAAREVDGFAGIAGRQRRDQQREAGRALAGVAAQGADQLRVLGGAGGDDEGLAALGVIVVALRVVVVLHLSASFWGGL
ncbi:MAG TPA: hypothetical protein VEB65_01930 [Solirubrobacterales bacterium]|nr:hypothetical protein [Solirubrobacterales bacterium]